MADDTLAPEGGAKKTNPQLAKAQAKIKATLAQFTTGQKTVTAIALLVVVVGGYLFMSWAGKPSYAPLFSNLSGTDAAAITQKLTQSHVPYQLSNGGTTIMVPSNDVYQQRIDMSAANLPSNNQQGYSLLDKEGITTSQFQQQVDYQRAVEGELDQTIESINGVQAAVVNVVIPQDNVFAGSTNQPSASVLVEMQPGQTLGASQVQAVVHLVASSIENLNPSDVSVTDQNGDVLAAPGVDSSAVAGSTANQQQTQTFEDQESTSLQNMLSQVLGPGMAVVRVAADLNFNQSQTTSKSYAKKGTPVSTNSTTETYTGASTTTQSGTLGQTATGTATNAATTTSTGTPTPGTPGSNYKQTQVQQSTAVGETDKSIVQAPGTIDHMSIAVLLNSSVKARPAMIQRIVSAAAGLSTKRGDSITVGSLSFNNVAEKQAAATLAQASKGKKQAALMSMVRTAMILLVVVLLVLYALRKLTKQTRTPIELPAEELELDDEDNELDLTRQLAALEPPNPELEASRARAALSAADAAALGDMIDQDPAAIAELLREWLAGERA